MVPGAGFSLAHCGQPSAAVRLYFKPLRAWL